MFMYMESWLPNPKIARNYRFASCNLPILYWLLCILGLFQTWPHSFCAGQFSQCFDTFFWGAGEIWPLHFNRWGRCGFEKVPNFSPRPTIHLHQFNRFVRFWWQYIPLIQGIYCLVRGYISYCMIPTTIFWNQRRTVILRPDVCGLIHPNLQPPDRWQMLFPWARMIWMIWTSSFFNLQSNSSTQTHTHKKSQNGLRNRWPLRVYMIFYKWPLDLLPTVRMARSPARVSAGYHEGEGLLAGASIGWVQLAWFRRDSRILIVATWCLSWFILIATLGLWNHHDISFIDSVLFQSPSDWLSNVIVVWWDVEV